MANPQKINVFPHGKTSTWHFQTDPRPVLVGYIYIYNPIYIPSYTKYDTLWLFNIAMENGPLK